MRSVRAVPSVLIVGRVQTSVTDLLPGGGVVVLSLVPPPPEQLDSASMNTDARTTERVRFSTVPCCLRREPFQARGRSGHLRPEEILRADYTPEKVSPNPTAQPSVARTTVTARRTSESGLAIAAMALIAMSNTRIAPGSLHQTQPIVTRR